MPLQAAILTSKPTALFSLSGTGISHQIRQLFSHSTAMVSGGKLPMEAFGKQQAAGYPLSPPSGTDDRTGLA